MAKADVESKVIGPKFERKSPRKAAPKKQAAEVEHDDTVCVALNRPTGIKFPMPDGSFVEIKGNGAPLIGQETGKLPIGAYGLTIIKASDWDYIVKNFGGMKIFSEGLCFATKKKADAKEEAESRDDLRNGLEPVDVDKLKTKEAKNEA